MSNLYIYKAKETQFNHRGLGALSDVINAIVEEEINGIYDLSFEYPYDGLNAELIEPGMIIKADTPKDPQLFRLNKVNKDATELIIRAHGNHISYDLVDNLVEDIFIRDKGSESAINQILRNTVYSHRFSAISSVAGKVSSRIVRKNPIQAIMGDIDNSLVTRLGGEIERDNFLFKWKDRLGEDRGFKIKYRKNLLGLSFLEDISGVATRIMPKGFDGLMLPEKYVDSPNIEAYSHIKIVIREYPDIISAQLSPEAEEALPHEQALEALRERAREEYRNKIDRPTITCIVNFIDLAKTEEYKEYKNLQLVYLGDTVTIVHKLLGIELQNRIVSYKYDPIEKEYLELQVGQLIEDIGANFEKSAVNKFREEIKSHENSFLEKAKGIATDLINDGYGGYVRIYPDRILILDADTEAAAINVWQFNKNGIGYSSTGINGPYTLAWTIDGTFNTDFINAHSITLNQLAADVGQSLDLSSNTSINARIYDLEDSVINRINILIDGVYQASEARTNEVNDSIDQLKSLAEQLGGNVNQLEEGQIEVEYNIAEIQSTARGIRENFNEVSALIKDNTAEIQSINAAVNRGIDKYGETYLELINEKNIGDETISSSVKITTKAITMTVNGEELIRIEDGKIYASNLYVTKEIGFGNHTAQAHEHKYTVFTPA